MLLQSARGAGKTYQFTIKECLELSRQVPTKLQVQAVVDRLGGFWPCAKRCKLPAKGRRVVRDWYLGCKPIPRLSWFVLLVNDRIGRCDYGVLVHLDKCEA